MALMRLAYASEATFEAQPLEKGVEPHVARILMASRRNNARAELVGGLYYGDNRFFQYLEGEEEFVRETFERIRQDSRHRNIRTLIEEPLGARTFSNWSMKYVPLSSDVKAFLEKHQLPSFNPAGFSGEQCEEMIELIRRSSEDQKLVNHDDHSALGQAQALAPGVKYGLLVAGALVVVALVAGALAF